MGMRSGVEAQVEVYNCEKFRGCVMGRRRCEGHLVECLTSNFIFGASI